MFSLLIGRLYLQKYLNSYQLKCATICWQPEHIYKDKDFFLVTRINVMFLMSDPFKVNLLWVQGTRQY